uniref:NR LBD domain-containing protein n=2 Tax=Caenorhabditis japonica TaxID=281687 RepID=A0A8R1IF00_CAEJA
MSLCKICDETGGSWHFGAITCRACAAFFRRKVAANEKLFQRCTGGCSLQNQRLRRLCAHCRFEKCLKSGMSKAAVLDRINSLLSGPSSSSSSFSSSSSSSSTSSEPPSLLEQLKEVYHNLEEARNVAFCRHRQTPKFCNYQQLYPITVLDLELVTKHLFAFFKSQEPKGDKEQNLLIEHFYIPFLMFEGAFRSQNSDLMILANGDYLDLSKVEDYYRGSDDRDDKYAKFATSVLEPYWKLNNRFLRKHLREVQLDLSEFLLVSALVYWDYGLPEQSDESVNVCTSKRLEVLAELVSYEKKHRGIGDDSMRVGEVMMILHAIQKSSNLMIEFREITGVYRLTRSCPLLSIVKK